MTLLITINYLMKDKNKLQLLNIMKIFINPKDKIKLKRINRLKIKIYNQSHSWTK